MKAYKVLEYPKCTNLQFKVYSFCDNECQFAIVFISNPQDSEGSLFEIHIMNQSYSIDEIINVIKELWPNLDVSSFLVVIFPELKAFQYNSQDVH